jgi:alpha-N-arabinofuranosidase
MIKHFKKIFLFIGVASALNSYSQNEIVLYADKGKEIINKNIYGHFAEHLGHCIYGGFYVGDTNKTIPHKDGVRLERDRGVKEIKSASTSLAGRMFCGYLSLERWNRAKERKTFNAERLVGKCKRDNSFGTNEFLNMCELLGAEPYLSGNVGSGTPQELSDWIKYTTHPNGSSPMTDLRQKNGRPNPWHVKYWGLGNEAWGCGGNMKVEYYANVFRQYATFMTNGTTVIEYIVLHRVHPMQIIIGRKY